MQGTSNADIQAELVFFLKKPYRVVSKNEIKLSRGIEFNSIVGEFGANNIPNKRKGFYKYYMTKLAFDKFKEENDVVINCLLD